MSTKESICSVVMSEVAQILNLGAFTGTAGAMTHERKYPWSSMNLCNARIWFGSLKITGITLDTVCPMLNPFSRNLLAS